MARFRHSPQADKSPFWALARAMPSPQRGKWGKAGLTAACYVGALDGRQKASAMFLKARVGALIAVALAVPALAVGEPATRPSAALTQAGAEAALQAAERFARQANDPAAIAVVDTDGLLMAFVRMDGVRPGSVELAIGKARSAALMQRPTAELEANVAGGRVGLATAGLTALGGGAPLKVGAETVGAIGVAGVKKEDDLANAAAVAAAFPAGQ